MQLIAIFIFKSELSFKKPPSNPVKETILTSLCLQYLAALITFLEFPLVDNAIIKSPGLAITYNCLKIIISKESVKLPPNF